MTPEELVKAGYYQISRRHRTVARLPPGKTGKEALAATSIGARVALMTEQQAADMYLRIYAKDQVQLDSFQFQQFLYAGGGTALDCYAPDASPQNEADRQIGKATHAMIDAYGPLAKTEFRGAIGALELTLAVGARIDPFTFNRSEEAIRKLVAAMRSAQRFVADMEAYEESVRGERGKAAEVISIVSRLTRKT